MSDQSENTIQETPPGPAFTPPAPKPVLTQQQKLRRFLIGFLGWWLVNVPLYLLADRAQGAQGSFLFIFTLNVIALLVMAFANRWVALGIVAAVALNLVISLFLGQFFNVFCWIPFTTPMSLN
jgi:hypothetical protein